MPTKGHRNITVFHPNNKNVSAFPDQGNLLCQSASSHQHQSIHRIHFWPFSFPSLDGCVSNYIISLECPPPIPPTKDLRGWTCTSRWAANYEMQPLYTNRVQKQESFVPRRKREQVAAGWYSGQLGGFYHKSPRLWVWIVMRQRSAEWCGAWSHGGHTRARRNNFQGLF